MINYLVEILVAIVEDFKKNGVVIFGQHINLGLW
jgi:hypothetical protein